MKNSLEPMRVFLTAQPSFTAWSTLAGACTMTMSTCLALSMSRDWPVPALYHCMLAPACLAKASPRSFSSPNSPGLPVARVNTLEPEP